MFKKSVEIQTKTNKIKLKMLPLVLKVTSIFAPEAAPVLLPLSTFLKTEAGKAMIEMGSKGQDALNEYINGDKEKAILLDGNFDEDWGDCLYLEKVLHHGEKKIHTVDITILPEEVTDTTPFYLMSLIIV